MPSRKNSKTETAEVEAEVVEESKPSNSPIEVALTVIKRGGGAYTVREYAIQDGKVIDQHDHQADILAVCLQRIEDRIYELFVKM